MKSNASYVDKPLAILSLAVVFASVSALAIYSKESIAMAEKWLFWVTSAFAAPVLIFTF